ncbi:hypothetical protein ASF17_07140 [Frigoribacterium sp. Leaf263]|uniref:hypothetical protein n=1 Tax=Frigoribacterium sp. Leaf263 TaxID=1736313 RepID=UPI0006F28570|nr:hypothetical protein [Frigoribacterium sp. Leaf263]KQO82789.1 hypothetical protein ASF17_07140 [Frigoribacterium sp. Leaf263]
MSTTTVGPYEAREVDGPAPSEWWTSVTGSGEAVLLRASPASAREALVEAAVLGSAEHPHVAEILDVFHDEGRVVVVTRGAPPVRLDAWLTGRGVVERGEAVTLVVPLASALAHLASRGIVPAGLSASDVAIDDRGAPVLLGLSRGIVVRSPDREHPAVSDLWALVAEQLDGRPGGGTPPSTPEELFEWAHDLGAPQPLPTVFGEIDRRPATGSPAEPEGALPAWASVLPESALVERAAAWWVSRSSTTLRERLRGIRPRFRVVAATLVVSVGAVAALNLAEGPAGGEPAASSSSTAPSPTTPGAEEPPETEATSVPDESPRDPTGVDQVIRGDDAAAAAGLLLEARARCLRDVTPSCLAAVDHAGSPLEDRDAVLLRDPGATEGVIVPIRLGAETQRLGESVLFTATTGDDEPASVLVVRTEAGWRLREITARR